MITEELRALYARVAVNREPRSTSKSPVHPLGDREFLVWLRPGRVIGRVRDSVQWQRDGAATPDLDEAGFAPMDEDAVIVAGQDAESPHALLGIGSPVLGCACGRFNVGAQLAEDIGAAIAQWWGRSHAGPQKAIRVIAN